jgi:hypothetical protein
VSHPTDWSWHFRAWRAGARWDRTRALLQDWLLSHTVSSDTLILMGGSAGWMMSPAFLQRFQTVVLIDIDPWAGRLFRLRHRHALGHRGTRLQFLGGDAHPLLDDVLARYPSACLLFDNFLGLDTLYTRDLKQTAERLKALRRKLKGRTWGSIHDRFSGPGTPHWEQAPCWQLDPQSLRATSGQPLPKALYESVQASGEWLDHSTEHIFAQGTPVQLIPWPLIRGRWHWLEAGWVAG